MKRLLLPLLVVLALFLLALPSAAASPEEDLSSLWELLPSLSGDRLPKDPHDAAALSEALGLRHLLSVMLEGARGATPALLLSLCLLAGVTVLFSLLSVMGEGLGGGVIRLSETLLGVMLLLLLYERTLPCFLRAASYLEDLSALSELAAPLMGGLYLAGGNAAVAAANGGAMAALSLLLEYLTGAALLPLLRIMLGFLLVSALGQVHTEGVTRTLRSLYITVLGIFSLLISASLALGTSLGSARDSLTLRSLRFAVGQMLPVVGGTVSGSLGAAMASLSLIRGTAGIGMAVAVLLPLLPIVAELFLVRASLSLLASFGEMLGAATPARLFRSYRALLDLVLAAVAMAGLLFIFLGATLSRCAPAVGV